VRPDPETLLVGLRDCGLDADLLVFGRGYYRSDLNLSVPFELDNVAVAPTESFNDWWKRLPQESRKNARVSAKRGVVVRAVDWDERLVTGIKRIYDETPVRQGRRFWHFQKDLARARAENATYLSRSQFVGAYLGDELVGFIKYVRVDDAAVLIQILGMSEHRHRKVTNALLTATVELCEQQGLKSLIYGKFDYGSGEQTSLAEFKHRNGFTKMVFPRYLVPVSARGRIALAAGLHHGIRGAIPPRLVTTLRDVRARIMSGRRKIAVTPNE